MWWIILFHSRTNGTWGWKSLSICSLVTHRPQEGKQKYVCSWKTQTKHFSVSNRACPTNRRLNNCFAQLDESMHDYTGTDPQVFSIYLLRNSKVTFRVINQVHLPSSQGNNHDLHTYKILLVRHMYVNSKHVQTQCMHSELLSYDSSICVTCRVPGTCLEMMLMTLASS